MTQVTTGGGPAAAGARTAAGAVPAQRVSFRDLLAAEWIKLWSLRSTYWVLALSGAAVVVANLNAARADHDNWPHYDAHMRAHFVPTIALQDAFTDISALFLMLAAASLGGMVVAGEYGSGLLRTTFTAVPDRRAVVAAKAAVLVPVFTVFGAVVAFTSFFGSQAILAGRHAGMALGDPGTVRLVLAATLLAPVSALAGMAIGALVRHSAGTMVTGVVVLMLSPQLFSDRHHITADINHALLFPAWTRLTNDGFGFPPGVYRAGVTGSWIVYAVWSVVASAVALAAVDRHDL